MGSLRERIAAYANASAQLLVQLEELDRLREQVRQAQLSPRDAHATERSQHQRRARERNATAVTGERVWPRTRTPSASD
jgi:hypothetical protein